jgi:orotidine-5'-phosphate decarboxylase
MTNFSDRLAESILSRRSGVCVGIDPDLSRLPGGLRAAYAGRVGELGDAGAVAACFSEFASGVIDAVADVVAAVKPQAAFFEQYGAPGWEALRRVVACAHEHELPVILDAKRGDIGSTSAAYAAAVFGGAPALAGGPLAGLGADAVTVNPYLGDDALAPFIERCEQGKGVFVLARTSNPGAAELQERDCDDLPLYLHVTEMIARLGSGRVGGHGYSDVGAVVGATAPSSLAAVRAALPHAFLLIPGFGAQGAGPEALVGLARGDALGYVVNASRSIIYAWRERGGDYRSAAAAAAVEMRDAIGGL